MPISNHNLHANQVGSRVFGTTNWSMVLSAGDESSPDSQVALEELCRTYWYPLYAYVRRMGYSVDCAKDLTQEFLAHFLRRGYFRAANRQRGKFRSFLLISLKHFLSHDWEKAHSVKRGGRVIFSSWDKSSPEDRYQWEPVCDENPEKLYERNWARTVLEQALRHLREEAVGAGKIPHFDRLKQFLSNEAAGSDYAEAATELSVTVGAVAVAVHRLRQRYGEVVRQEIARTISDQSDLEEEVRYLIELVSA